MGPALWGTTGLFLCDAEGSGCEVRPESGSMQDMGVFTQGLVRVSPHSEGTTVCTQLRQPGGGCPRSRHAECDQHPVTGLGRCMALACPLKMHRDAVTAGRTFTP